MDFTREPVIETIITPKEGFKLVVRNSKVVGQEEFLVDSLEIVSFSHAMFYRCLERPKHFLAPTTDYEVLEVRDTRVVLKHQIDSSEKGSIKINSPKEKELPQKKHKPIVESDDSDDVVETSSVVNPPSQNSQEQHAHSSSNKKRDRKRMRKRRSGAKEDKSQIKEGIPSVEVEFDDFDHEETVMLLTDDIVQDIKTPPVVKKEEPSHKKEETSQTPQQQPMKPRATTLLPPPPGLISDRVKEMRLEEERIAQEKQQTTSLGLSLPPPPPFFFQPSVEARKPSDVVHSESQAVVASPIHQEKEIKEDSSEKSFDSDSHSEWHHS